MLIRIRVLNEQLTGTGLTDQPRSYLPPTVCPALLLRALRSHAGNLPGRPYVRQGYTLPTSTTCHSPSSRASTMFTDHPACARLPTLGSLTGPTFPSSQIASASTFSIAR